VSVGHGPIVNTAKDGPAFILPPKDERISAMLDRMAGVEGSHDN
jgi:hypothetical protein